jgi:hypothetical protein
VTSHGKKGILPSKTHTQIREFSDSTRVSERLSKAMASDYKSQWHGSF